MKRRFDIETEDLHNIRRQKNYKLVHVPSINQVNTTNTNVLKQAQYIHRGELKNVDTFNTWSIPNDQTWHSTELLNNVLTGTSATTRIGRKITMTKLQLRFAFGPNVSGNGVVKFRILIVYDKATNGVAPAIADILDIVGGSPDFHPLAFNNLSNSDRFIILADVIPESPLSFYDIPFGLISRNINLDTIFNSTAGGTSAAISSGGVYMFISQALVSLVTACDCSWYARIRYND